MKKKIIAILFLIVFVMLIFAGCRPRKGLTVVQVVIKPNSFKESYEVDEQLNFASIFILITYDNGENVYVQCDNTMVKGFDTLTTGEKQLYVEYGGVKSESFDYEVFYSIDNSKKILTSARLEYTKGVNNEILGYGITYYCGDLINVNAIMFSLYGEQSLSVNNDLSNLSLELPTGWSYYVEYISEQTLRILLYNKDNEVGLSTNASFIVSINKGNSEAVTWLKDIEVSTIGDNATKYYIPDYMR
ncbi:MAG TPA: bacterial Ig-like domain-containing protein [Clostridia bacterium]|nr:bacterial Ig-like domain-containing protein [Clostridia bacterium]